jgi:hypothetical protein
MRLRRLTGSETKKPTGLVPFCSFPTVSPVGFFSLFVGIVHHCTSAMAGTQPVKALFVGDVQGNLDLLFKRVSAANASSGPFNVLFCVGPFFPPSGKCI